MGFLKIICCGGKDPEEDERQGSGRSSGRRRPTAHEVGSVTLLSKPWKGDSYTIDGGRLEQFRGHLERAKKRVRKTITALDAIERYGVNKASVLDERGSIFNPFTPLGHLAHMFNLVRNADSIRATDKELVDLVHNVRAVLEMIRDGLESELVVGGIPEAKLEGDAGYVSYKRGRDTHFPERVEKAKTGKDVPLPELEVDSVFLNPKLQMAAKIHIDYRLLDGRGAGETPKDRMMLRGKNPAWAVLIHEASHKFARTRDVNYPYSYSEKDRKDMHWTHAIRNAEHYAYLCQTIQLLKA